MIDVPAVTTWVEAYLRAWQSNDPAAIGDLFSEDASYYTSPFGAPWRGRAAIVAGWLDRQDQADNIGFRFSVLATTADTGIVRGWTQYYNPPREYSNIWLIRFDASGRCHEFTEWWMERET